MTKILPFLLILSLNLTGCCKKENQAGSPADLVNPLIGTDSKYELSNGNTYPAIALPWGMNFWTPQTNRMGNGWAYQYAANKIRGFRQTHQPSPWINEYGAFSLFATSGAPVFDEDRRESWYSHKAETAKPYYYSCYLADYNTKVEITPTERAAAFRITYPEGEANLVVDAFFKGSYVKVLPGENKLIGYARNASGGVPDNFRNWFVMTWDEDPSGYIAVVDGKQLPDETEAEGEHAGMIIRFNSATKLVVNVRVASSFISTEQAWLNLEQEIGQRSFEAVRNEARDTWNRMLSRIQVEGGTESQQATFYTALYRAMLFPREFHETDREGKILHYSPYNGEICEGYLFTDNGFWDTFRAVFPFFTLVFPEQNSRIMQGLVNTYRESGWLPEWASPGHRDCMIGSNSASIIADSYLKGIRGYDIETLWEAIMKNTENEGPLTSVGRYGVGYYNRMGYIPYDVGINENVARTLEYSYDDFTIRQLAKALGKPGAVADTFTKRALYYKNVFDPTVNFMRGRMADGSFQSPFRPDKWGDAFTEGCSWHWTWCVFHDVAGLIDLMGGKEQFTAKLDSVFIAAPTFDDSYYGVQIHEITEMLIMNMGQYAHGNQPIQHMPYLYTYAGVPWKTQFHVREIMDKLYLDAPDGLCGDEDNGQTSAWYVFSAMGFYPVAPGTGEYVLGSPLFRKVTLNLENGKQFIVEAKDNEAGNRYIRNARLNGKKYTASFLTHEMLTDGGVLSLDMAAEPNPSRGIRENDLPYSMSREK